MGFESTCRLNDPALLGLNTVTTSVSRSGTAIDEQGGRRPRQPGGLHGEAKTEKGKLDLRHEHKWWGEHVIFTTASNSEEIDVA
jgi:hypothetical protein